MIPDVSVLGVYINSGKMLLPLVLVLAWTWPCAVLVSSWSCPTVILDLDLDSTGYDLGLDSVSSKVFLNSTLEVDNSKETKNAIYTITR